MTNFIHVIKEQFPTPIVDTQWDSARRDDVVFEPAPCDDCKSYDYCAENEAACLDFSRYVNTGKIFNSKRDPSRSIYKRIFSTHHHLNLRSTDGGT